MSSTREFYINQADTCARAAAETNLSQVRDRNLRSEAAWREMADRLQRAEEMRDATAAAKAAA